MNESQKATPPSRPKESARERKENTQAEPPKFLFLKTWGIVFLIVSILYLIAR